MNKHNLGVEKDCSWGVVGGEAEWVEVRGEIKEGNKEKKIEELNSEEGNKVEVLVDV